MKSDKTLLRGATKCECIGSPLQCRLKAHCQLIGFIDVIQHAVGAKHFDDRFTDLGADAVIFDLEDAVSPAEKDSVRAPWSVSSEGFGKFMCDIFDVWIKSDIGECFVSLFDATLVNMCGLSPGICAYDDHCGCNPVIESNGIVYPCDHFVYRDSSCTDLFQN